MGAMGVLALLANGVCFALLWRHRADDINMSSVWLCSRNDLIANVSVVAAAGGVLLTRSGWPDMVVGIAIAALFARSAITVLSESGRELRRADADHQATRSIPAGRSHD
jgi:Co/Zn/Cd efflux system component